MSRSSIYNYTPFDVDEKHMLLSPVGNVINVRYKNNVPFEHLDDLMSKEEYMEHKSEEEKLYDLFLLFRHRGDFESTKKYEILSNHNEVKEFENIPRDLFIKNELEYYKWRKGNA